MINGKKVAIDARMIEMSGIGTYVQHLMGQGIYDYAYGKEEIIRKYDKEVQVIPFDAAIYSPKEQVCFPNEETKKAGIQLVHFPHYNVPLSYCGDFVVTVHDLTHIILPEFLGNKLKYYYAKVLMSHALQKSKHIFTVSENSRKDICKLFHINPEKISITYNAVDSDFRTKTEEEIEYLYGKYNIPKEKKILLYVGNLKPHKNLGGLLKAMTLLRNKEDYCLVLAGKAFSGLELSRQEQELGLSKQVIHTGLVTKEELIDLYNIADLFVFPSLYEGFGIPPLEAMACGTPVVAANNSSIPEVVGDAAILFNAASASNMVEAIEKVVDSSEVRALLVKNGYLRCQSYRWEATVNNVKNKMQGLLK